MYGIISTIRTVLAVGVWKLCLGGNCMKWPWVRRSEYDQLWNRDYEIMFQQATTIRELQKQLHDDVKPEQPPHAPIGELTIGKPTLTIQTE